ncbi:MAG: hypothetical protein AB1635_05645 [Acidobacteriota bacterium]
MRVLALVVALGVASPLAAQGPPTEPVTFGEGRLVIGGEATATIGPDDPGFFNYSDYAFNALRNLRVHVTTEVRAARHLQFLSEFRLDRSGNVEPFALYARIRPFPDRRFDIQVGRIPPTFGAFARQGYGSGNMLVGTPLAYQYLLSIRPDALPARVDDLLRMRGRGWLSNFPLGNTAPAPGLPMVQSYRLDTGLQVHGVAGMVEWTGAVTSGSLSNPRVTDDNGSRQLAGRVVVRPHASVAFGFSGARGGFLRRELQASLAAGADVADGVQTGVAVDVEYSVGRFLARGEVMRSAWSLPAVPTLRLSDPLTATAAIVEGRYRLWPGVHVAGRVERLDFSTVSSPTRTAEWEAPVDRVELGTGWSVVRNVQVKVSWQRNLRSGGRVRHDTIVAGQLVYWF